MAKFNTYSNSVGTTGKNDTHFSKTVSNDIKKSSFYRDQIHKTTFDAGQLIPIYIDEVLPGDTHEIDIAHITRLATPLFPTMDNIDLDFYFFFVPNRITWKGWQALHGENTSSAWKPTSQPALVPGIRITSDTKSFISYDSIGRYYGIPQGIVAEGASGMDFPISCLPLRGYYQIYNRWFRDQNLQAPLVVDISDTPMNDTLFFNTKPFTVNKKHDYFTSCLPAPLKAVTSGALRQNPILGSVLTFPTTGLQLYDDTLKNAPNFVQQLRTATQLTKLLERDARSGTRYIEVLKAHFNVEAEDYRLQDPEFLGHCSTSVGIHQVAQTSATNEVTPQGNLSAFAMSAGNMQGFKKSFVEHGYIHGFVVARQRKTYQQGLERFWLRRDRFDFYYPELAHISEQPVYTCEIFADSNILTSPMSFDVFGFQEAWADYRYKPNRVSGQFDSDPVSGSGAPIGSLDAWHYADVYSNIPVLSDAFIKDNSRENINRTLAVQEGMHQFIMDLKVSNKTTRPMPVYSIPGFMDHF